MMDLWDLHSMIKSRIYSSQQVQFCDVIVELLCVDHTNTDDEESSCDITAVGR